MARLAARDEKGATAVEFALVMIPMLVIIFGLIQYGLYFYSAQTGSNTVNAAARQLSVGNCQNSTQLAAYVNGQLGAAKTANATIVRAYKNPDGTTPTPSVGTAAGVTTTGTPVNVAIGGNVTLTVTFPTINMHFPFVPFLSDSKIVREVEARVEDTTDEGCGS